MFIDQALFQKSAISLTQFSTVQKCKNMQKCVARQSFCGLVPLRFGSPLPPKIAILGSAELGWSLVGLPCEVTGQLRVLNQEQMATVRDHWKARKDSANSCNQVLLFKQLLRNLTIHTTIQA